MNDLKNKNMIVTGASGGIGNSIIKRLYENEVNKIGAYKVKMNMTNYDMITMLRSGNQTPIKLTFSYARKMDDLAEKITSK